MQVSSNKEFPYLSIEEHDGGKQKCSENVVVVHHAELAELRRAKKVPNELGGLA